MEVNSQIFGTQPSTAILIRDYLMRIQEKQKSQSCLQELI